MQEGTRWHDAKGREGKYSHGKSAPPHAARGLPLAVTPYCHLLIPRHRLLCFSRGIEQRRRRAGAVIGELIMTSLKWICNS